MTKRGGVLHTHASRGYTPDEIDLMYDHWLADQSDAPVHGGSLDWGREAWRAAFKRIPGPNDEQWNAALDAAAQMFYVDADVIDATYEQRFLRVYAKRIEALKRIPATGSEGSK